MGVTNDTCADRQFHKIQGRVSLSELPRAAQHPTAAAKLSLELETVSRKKPTCSIPGFSRHGSVHVEGWRTSLGTFESAAQASPEGPLQSKASLELLQRFQNAGQSPSPIFMCEENEPLPSGVGTWTGSWQSQSCASP